MTLFSNSLNQAEQPPVPIMAHHDPHARQRRQASQECITGAMGLPVIHGSWGVESVNCRSTKIQTMEISWLLDVTGAFCDQWTTIHTSSLQRPWSMALFDGQSTMDLVTSQGSFSWISWPAPRLRCSFFFLYSLLAAHAIALMLGCAPWHGIAYTIAWQVRGR